MNDQNSNANNAKANSAELTSIFPLLNLTRFLLYVSNTFLIPGAC